MAPTVIHLRSETKDLERRSFLSPTSAKALVEAGYVVNVERSVGRIYEDEEFESGGATLVPEGSWVNAPKNHIIAGLKELQNADCGGTLYDIEFLTDLSGKRVAAFGYYAGYAGAAVALLAWSHQVSHPGTALPSISSYSSESALITAVKSTLADALFHNASQHPRVLIVGALGRCGTGATEFCLAAGVPTSSIIKWDMAETARDGPFSEITAADIFINCIYLGAPIKPFVTHESLAKPGRKLRVACDVSCDPNDPYNPMPIYTEISTFVKPTVPVETLGDGPELTVVSIDHLPSLIAREASDAFSSLLLPSMMVLDKRNEEGVWVRAENLFHKMVKELPTE